MIKYFHMVPSNPWEYLNGRIGSTEITESNKNQWDPEELYDTEREARIAWIRKEYNIGEDVPDEAFDERGCLKR